MDPIVYPPAIWKPLLGHSIPETFQQRNMIVLHITEGSTAEGAYQTFKSSVAPRRVSAHFIIDRDGTVWQLMDLRDTAWHASQANKHSIGVEHVAMAGKLLATDAQYAASAALMQWLCKQMQMPIDRHHIRTHNEASPADGHVLCCTGALDPDRVVMLAAQGDAP